MIVIILWSKTMVTITDGAQHGQYPREGHGFSEYYHQRDQIRRELEWMTKYVLGGARQTTTAQ